MKLIEIVLVLEDIYPIKALERTPQSGGIYIWGFKPSHRFIPYYVGKSRNIRARLTEHLVQIMGGGYDIYNMANLDEIYKLKTIPYKSWDIHRLDDCLNIIDFIQERGNKYKPHIDAMLRSMHFTFASIPRGLEYKDMTDLEKSVINQLTKERLSNQKAGNSRRYIHKNMGNKATIEMINKNIELELQ